MRFFLKISIYCIFAFLLNPAFSQTQDASCPLENKTIAVHGGTISYLVGGKGPPVLLIHGLFAQKEQWMEVGCAMAKEGFDVIALDLPGYGASNGYPVTVYPLDTQVEILHEWRSRLGKNTESGRINIAGSSMGGTIAALYAKKYPNDIKTLAFIGAPMGVIGWSPQVKKAIFEGVNPFIPINEKQFELEMSLLFFQPPVIDANIKEKLIEDYIDNNRHYQQVWDIVNLYDQALDRSTKRGPRTLILWGEHDGIFNIEGMGKLKKEFMNSQATQFSDSAHLLMLEQSKRVVTIYGDFLRK